MTSHNDVDSMTSPDVDNMTSSSVDNMTSPNVDNMISPNDVDDMTSPNDVDIMTSPNDVDIRTSSSMDNMTSSNDVDKKTSPNIPLEALACKFCFRTYAEKSKRGKEKQSSGMGPPKGLLCLLWTHLIGVISSRDTHLY